MRDSHLLAVVFALAVFSGTLKAAEAPVPETSGPFGKFCKTNFEACSGKITEVGLDALAAAYADPNAKVCAVPRGIEHDTGNHAIIDWLNEHEEAAGLSTAEGIKTAIKSLWNCQDKVATGVTTDGLPDHTSRYLAFCSDKKNYVKCANQALSVSLDALAALLMNDDHTHCTAPEGTTTQALYAKVIAWLNAHPETHDMETEPGIATAIDAVWPCK